MSGYASGPGKQDPAEGAQDSSLLRVSPLDGRYAKSTEELQNYFSEHAFIKYRVQVEAMYFLMLCKELRLDGVSAEQQKNVRDIYLKFTVADSEKVKATERVTNHDVKAIEYFVKDKLDELGLQKYREFVHFALTSEDVNSTASPYALKEYVQNGYRPLLQKHVLEPLRRMAEDYKEIPFLTRTHGQPATPTRFGKEMMVFVERVEKQVMQLGRIPFTGKLGGATGGMNAHFIAYPKVDWTAALDRLYSEQFGMERQRFTTQLEHYDDTAAVFDCVKRINTILIDLSRDVWQYISMEYFKLKVIAGEVGSSAMPHKVNPIDFENAEGNFGIANAMFEHLASKLPISRLQRDLSDSTVRRNFGVPFGHTVVAIKALSRGLGKLTLNEEALQADLDKHWQVTAEAVQTVLRRAGYDQPYEALKKATRGKEIDQASMAAFVQTLDAGPEVKAELAAITPSSFALAAELDIERYDKDRKARGQN